MTYIDTTFIEKYTTNTNTPNRTGKLYSENFGKLRTESENFGQNRKTDKYAVCTLKVDKLVGHLKEGKTGRFAKTVLRRPISTIHALQS